MLGLDSKGEVWDYGCTGWGHPVLLLAESLSRSPCLHLEGGQLIVEGAPLNPSVGPQGREGRVLVPLGGWAAGAEQGRDFQLWEVFPALASAHPLLSVPTELLY